MSMRKIGILGSGIIGLSLGYKLSKLFKDFKIIIFEKESDFGLHQSGRNSGVLHCGLAYQPGSLKSKLAISGIEQMTNFCRKHDIPHDICGKIVVASNAKDVHNLDALAKNGSKNGLKNLKFLNKNELKKREPNVISSKTLLVPNEGIVDYKLVMKKFTEKIIQNGGEIIFNSKIENIKNKNNKVLVNEKKSEYELDLLFNCTGLFSDRNYTKYTTKKSPLKIIPFRGEYMMLKPEYNLFNNLIYPVADKKYPFLGIHFTRLINNDLEVGPNAVLAFKREGYVNTDFSLKDTAETLSYIGFYKFILKNFKFSMNEFSSSFFREVFIRRTRRIIPDIKSSMLTKGIAGVRAQSMNSSGGLVMDFKILKEGNQVHVLNAPSPGATASLAIADYIIKNYT